MIFICFVQNSKVGKLSQLPMSRTVQELNALPVKSRYRAAPVAGGLKRYLGWGRGEHTVTFIFDFESAAWRSQRAHPRPQRLTFFVVLVCTGSALASWCSIHCTRMHGECAGELVFRSLLCNRPAVTFLPAGADRVAKLA